MIDNIIDNFVLRLAPIRFGRSQGRGGMPSNDCGALLTPLTIRGARLKNRIMSTGHDTTLPTEGLVNDALIAYQEARARGGAGLIIVQVAGVHETARYTNHILMASSDACIPGYRRLADA